MGMTEVVTVLNNNYPSYLSYSDIMERANITRRAVFRILKQLKKHDEIEYKLVPRGNNGNPWVTVYRVKKRRMKECQKTMLMY